MAEWGKFTANQCPYIVKNGEKILKVAEPYYSQENRLISAFCPHCGLELNRVWNLEYCGSCGGRITWHNISIKDYGDIP